MNEGLKDKINHLKNEIDALRPLDKDTEGRIQQKFRLDWNFHSNNIEGNSLTFGETKTFLLHGITADGKPLKDHLDIKGHNQALEMLEDIVHDGRDLSENFIREMHQIILHEPYDKPAITPDGKKVKRHIQVGSYKTQPNHVVTKTGETFYFAKPEETPALMNDLMAWYNNAISERKLHPIELAALLHYKFIRIHPFDDGNGRLSRILMNLSLMKFGFPPVIIKTQKKEEYYRALQQADGGDSSFFVDYIAKLQIESLELYLRGAKGEHIEEEDDLDKEISILKAQLNKNDNNKYVLNKSYLIDTLIPIFQEIQDTLNKKLDQSFTSLFSEHNSAWSINLSSVYSGKFNLNFPNIDSLINLSSLPLTIEFLWNWQGFKSFGFSAFNFNYKITIQLFKQNWTVTFKEKPDDFVTNPVSYEFSYSTEINESIVSMIVKQVRIETLAEFKKLTEDSKLTS